MPRIALLLLLLLVLPAIPAEAAGESPAPAPNLVLSAGAADIFDSAPFACANVNYRPAVRWFGILGPDLMAGTGRHHEFYAAAGRPCYRTWSMGAFIDRATGKLRRPRPGSRIRPPILHLPPTRLALRRRPPRRPYHLPPLQRLPLRLQPRNRIPHPLRHPPPDVVTHWLNLPPLSSHPLATSSSTAT